MSLHYMLSVISRILSIVDYSASGSRLTGLSLLDPWYTLIMISNAIKTPLAYRMQCVSVSYALATR